MALPQAGPETPAISSKIRPGYHSYPKFRRPLQTHPGFSWTLCHRFIEGKSNPDFATSTDIPGVIIDGLNLTGGNQAGSWLGDKITRV